MAEVGPLRVDQDGPVVRVRLDCGRTNALDRSAVAALADVTAEAEATASTQVLFLTGRPGIFCAGLDTETLRAGGEDAAALMRAMEDLAITLLRSRLRVVACVNGHAVGAGALLLLCADVRIGAKGEFRIGFPEVGTGRQLSAFTIALARQRLNRRFFEAATLLGRLYTPADAIDVGFIDRVEGAGKALRVAGETAEGLARLPEAAYLSTLADVRGALLQG